MKCSLQDEPLSLIKKIEMEASKISGVVSLAQGVPWYQIPNSVVDFLTEKIAKGDTNRYSVSNGLPQLREHIALKYFQNNGLELDSENEIIITAGAIEAISSILLTVVSKGEEVMLLDPSYASYKGCVMITGGSPNYIPLDENLDLDVENMISNINENTRAIVLANPNNPTGSIFSLEKLKQLLEAIKGKDILLVVDEVYDEFVFEENDFESAIDLFEEYKDNLIIVNSWSKTFGMTGWRVGYMIAKNDLTCEVIKVHDSLVTCAPVHSQWAALATFEIYDERTSKVRKELQQRRDYVVNRLNKLTDFIEFENPGATYFVFPKFRYTDDDYNECMKILKEKKIALVPGSGFGSRGKGHFRLCFGRDFEDIKSGLDRLEDYFNSG